MKKQHYITVKNEDGLKIFYSNKAIERVKYCSQK